MNKFVGIPVGSYPAVVGGYVSVFKIKDVTYEAKCTRGVRGFNIRDTITVTEDGTVTSNLIGVAESVLIKVGIAVETK